MPSAQMTWYGPLFFETDRPKFDNTSTFDAEPTWDVTPVVPGGSRIVIAKTPGAITGALGPFTGALDNSGETIELRDTNGNWQEVSATSVPLPGVDLRKAAVEKLRRSGFRYFVISGEWATTILPHPEAWGFELVGSEGGVHLLRIPPRH